jgi:hypothetical protein
MLAAKVTCGSWRRLQSAQLLLLLLSSVAGAAAVV